MSSLLHVWCLTIAVTHAALPERAAAVTQVVPPLTANSGDAPASELVADLAVALQRRRVGAVLPLVRASTLSSESDGSRRMRRTSERLPVVAAW